MMSPPSDIEVYRKYLDKRYQTVRSALEQVRLAARTTQQVVAELGTTRSYVSAGRMGFMLTLAIFWTPRLPHRWDWGAGAFTKMCATHLQDARAELHSVDICPRALHISKVMTRGSRLPVHHHLTDSESFLRTYEGRLDLLYMDAGDSSVVASELHLREAEIVVQRDLIRPGGHILVDDVEVDNLPSKGLYSIPYFLENGFEVQEAAYQVLLRRRSTQGSL
jgi:hypothetical protein